MDPTNLFAGFKDLPVKEQAALCEQLATLEAERISAWSAFARSGQTASLDVDQAEPVRVYPLDMSRRAWDRAMYRERGEELLRAGQVAAFTVAGGQGTRLGYDGPKGEYPAGPVSKRSLFAMFGEGIRATADRYGATVPWYVMTSVLNHDRTQAFFEQNNWFGLNPADVILFSQGVLPTFDLEGRLLLAAPGRIATNPDGHGGSLKALVRSGAIADMRRRGITQISYFQVDNPALRILDPVFLGLHIAAPDSSAEMSSKMVRKIRPEERVGVFGRLDGRVHVMEYSDLSAEHAAARRPDGSLRFDAGNMAVHVLSVDFVEQLDAGGDFVLPLHRAKKRVSVTDSMGQTTEVDAIKLETFVFDALPRARASIVLEADRIEEFAPIKNADGADSPMSSARLLTKRAARWLATHGVTVPLTDDGEPDCLLEIPATVALDAQSLALARCPTEILPKSQWCAT